MEEVVLIIESAIRRSRNQKLIFGAIAVCSGIFLFLFPFNIHPHSAKITVRVIFMLIATGGTVLLISGASHLDPSKHPLAKLIKNKSRKIVWIYPFIIETRPYGIKMMKSATIFFRLSDGSYHSIKINEKKVNAVMNMMQKHLSTATFGYSLEKEQLYRADPSLLIRDQS